MHVKERDVTMWLHAYFLI